MARLRCVPLVLIACLATPPGAAAADRSRTRAELARSMRAAGPASGALVIDLGSGDPLYASRPDVRRVPASVQKLYTTSTALLGLGPDARLATQALGEAPVDAAGALEGDLYLRGMGDPTFGTPQLQALARAVVEDTGLARVRGRVVGDESAFDRRRGPPASGHRTSVYVGPLSALAFNRGVTGISAPFFQVSPGLFAAQAFERALRREGVRFDAHATTGITAAAAPVLAQGPSPPLADIVRRTNRPSDNYYAEMLIKVIGARLGDEGSTRGGARVIRRVMAEVLGVAPQVSDGSGLGRSNRTSPRQVVTLLGAMARHPVAGRAFEASLPLAGRSGTLVGRMRRTAAAGNCTAKTGTLSSVSTLAGYCTAADGTTRVAFAFLMNHVSPARARPLQDRMAVALAGYDG